MKKLVMLLLLLIIPFTVKAVEPDYDVEGYFAIHQINEDGSVTVKEAIVLDGDMNGYERQLIASNSRLTNNETINFEHDAIYNPSRISNIKVAAYNVNRKQLSYKIVDREVDYSKQVENARIGDKNKYTVAESNNQYTIKNYYSCRSCTVAYYFEYTIEEVTVIHEDIAEIYYQLFTYNYVTENMGIIDMVVHYPAEDPDSKMWAHGNVYGEVKRIDNKSFLIHSDKFTKGSELDYRTLFKKELITNDTELRHSNVEAIPSIMEVEKKRAEEREKEIARIKRMIRNYQYISYAYVSILVLLIIYIYFAFDKEHKVSFNYKYYREFIEDYDVEIIDYLMNKSVTPNAMSASIMNLIYKKKISAEPLDDKKKEYKFTLLSEEGISKREKKLIDFLFTKIGKGEEFTTKELKSYAKSTKTYDSFTASYNSWTKEVRDDSIKEEFYQDLTNIKFFAILYIIIGIVIWFSSINTIDGFVFSHTLIFFCVPALIYFIVFRKKTERGQLHYKKWKAFKNFLNDFGDFKVKELPEIVLWERYLVYATVFGLADKVQKAMNVKIKELEAIDGYDITPFGYYYGYSNFSHVVSQSISSAHNLAISTAAAQSSNSSGGGGGFSGGGGFGGGGGGGHGF